MSISPGWSKAALHDRVERWLDIDLAKDKLELGHRLRQIQTTPLRIGASILEIGYRDQMLSHENFVGYTADLTEFYGFTPKLAGIWVGATVRQEQSAAEWNALERYLAQAALSTPAFLGFESVASLHETVESAARIRAERSRLYEPARGPVIPVYEGYADMPDAQWRHEVRMLAASNLPVMISLYDDIIPLEDMDGYSFLAVNQLQLADEKLLAHA